MRWCTKDEVLSGKGQFTCASLSCSRGDQVSGEGEGDELGTFELNFGYVEEGIKKNALVKVRVCRKCSKKLKEARRDEGRDDQRCRSREGTRGRDEDSDGSRYTRRRGHSRERRRDERRHREASQP